MKVVLNTESCMQLIMRVYQAGLNLMMR